MAGERRALAKAITLIESTRADHQQQAEALLTGLLPHTGQAIRIGISGAPGAGKSTFIEALGLWLIEQGKKLAVLAVDPSSSINGGSILGDKTRMERLCQQDRAFIRPSPAAGSLGGVAEKTREAMLLCEAAGFEVIIVETVGVGQSEISVAGMVDCFTLLQLPNAGDDLQAIKKGIVELADVVLINKSDINPQAAALTRAQWRNALALLTPAAPGWRPPVLNISALQKAGVDKYWSIIMDYRSKMSASGNWQKKRQQQSLAWMWQCIDSGLRQHFQQHRGVSTQLQTIAAAVRRGELAPTHAARQLLEKSRSPCDDAAS